MWHYVAILSHSSSSYMEVSENEGPPKWMVHSGKSTGGTPIYGTLQPCEVWEPILEASKIPERPNFYVHCPTRTVEAVEAVEAVVGHMKIAGLLSMKSAW